MKPSFAARLTVVIPTYNRPLLLRECLASVREATPHDTEILIADDGSSDETATLVAEVSRCDDRVRHLYGRNGGPAFARNRGWQAASANVVAFVDDDCVVELGWGEALLAALGANPAWAGVEGQTLPRGEVVDAFVHSIQSQPGAYLSCNLAVRREALQRVGGFDEGFPFPACEDVDLCLRIVKAVGPIGFSAAAVAKHGCFPIGPGYYLRRVSWEASQYRFFARHPERLAESVGRARWLAPVLTASSPVAVATYLIVGRLRAARGMAHGKTVRERTVGVAVMLSTAILGLARIPEGAREYRKATSERERHAVVSRAARPS